MKATQLLPNGAYLKSNDLQTCHQEHRCTRLGDSREAGEGPSPLWNSMRNSASRLSMSQPSPRSCSAGNKLYITKPVGQA
jgi:hypothetical protein